MTDLGDITEALGESYDEWKSWEKRKNIRKDEFFAAATEELKDEVLSQRVETIDAGGEEQALRIAQRRYYNENITDIRRIEGEDRWQVVIEEDPALRPFTYINKHDGRVYSRQLVTGTPLLDDESIREEDPELWEQITEEVTERKMKSLDDMTDEELAAIQPYIYAPKPSVKLGPPRKAKPEELDESSE